MAEKKEKRAKKEPEKKQDKSDSSPEKTDTERVEDDQDFGGFPNRDLKKNLGCGG